MALTKRPAPPRIRVPLVASPIVSRGRKGGGAYVICACGVRCAGVGAGAGAVEAAVGGRCRDSGISGWNWIALTVPRYATIASAGRGVPENVINIMNNKLHNSPSRENK